MFFVSASTLATDGSGSVYAKKRQILILDAVGKNVIAKQKEGIAT
jgi:hypothetical protein